MLIVAALSAIGVSIRILVARQPLFADELSTYWIVATHGLGGVLSLLYSTASIHHAEITPPLSFLASWVTVQLGHAPELLRAPSLAAGTLTIPVVYLLGERTVGRRAALVATALTALSPFMIYYSTEARSYGVLMLTLAVATLAMLLAVDSRRTRWWVLYSICSCGAMYTHYTAAFVLAAQLAWLSWVHPHARRAALLANLGAAAGFIPWIPGFINDWTSPTVKILSALSPFTLHDIPTILGHWAIGYPYSGYVGLRQLPGTAGLVLLTVSVILALPGAARRARGTTLRAWVREHPRLVLILVLAIATPLGEAIVSTFSTHLFGVRNLAASWPAFALVFAALLTAGGPRVRLAASGLALACFALGAGLMLKEPYARPNYKGAGDFIDHHYPSIAAVIDTTGEVSPGPLTPLDLTLRRPVRVLRAGSPAEREHPFGFADPIVPLSRAIASAVAAARGGAIVLVSSVAPVSAQIPQRAQPVTLPFPAPYHLAEEHVYRGIIKTEVRVYSAGAWPGA